MEYQEFGSVGKPVVLLLKADDTTLHMPEEVLRSYYFVVPRRLSGGREAAEEIAGLIRRRFSGKVEALCCTAEGWALVRELDKRRIGSNQIIAECDAQRPGSLIAKLLEETLAMHGKSVQ